MLETQRSSPNMFVVNMLFVMMLLLDCLVRVYGVRVEDTTGTWSYGACIANPAGCTLLYAARPPSDSVCEPATRSPSLSGWAGLVGDAGALAARG